MVWDITADWALYARELSENADADEKRVNGFVPDTVLNGADGGGDG
jgi:hypothetical protein